LTGWLLYLGTGHQRANIKGEHTFHLESTGGSGQVEIPVGDLTWLSSVLLSSISAVTLGWVTGRASGL